MEVPYAWKTAWVGLTWTQVAQAGGWPDVPAVQDALGTMPESERLAVSGWLSFDAYRAGTGRTACPVGRAWLTPGEDGTLRVFFGLPHGPVRVGRRNNWRRSRW